MPFASLPDSKHELVLLRPIVEPDLSIWYAYLSTPVVFEHTSWDLSSVDDLSRFVGLPKTNADSSILRFAIALRSNDELVGTAGFHSISVPNRSAELTYDLAPRMWGQGIATCISQVLIEWAHVHAGLHRVQATVLETNHRSAAVLQRCGFQLEGFLRSYRMVRGRPGNFFMYSHIASSNHVSLS